jgi:hypothetical protein
MKQQSEENIFFPFEDASFTRLARTKPTTIHTPQRTQNLYPKTVKIRERLENRVAYHLDEVTVYENRLYACMVVEELLRKNPDIKIDISKHSQLQEAFSDIEVRKALVNFDSIFVGTPRYNWNLKLGIPRLPVSIIPLFGSEFRNSELTFIVDKAYRRSSEGLQKSRGWRDEFTTPSEPRVNSISIIIFSSFNPPLFCTVIFLVLGPILYFKNSRLKPFSHITGKPYSQISAVRTDAKILRHSMYHNKHTAVDNNGNSVNTSPTEETVTISGGDIPTHTQTTPLIESFFDLCELDEQQRKRFYSCSNGNRDDKQVPQIQLPPRPRLRYQREIDEDEESALISRLVQLQNEKSKKSLDLYDIYLSRCFTNSEIDSLIENGVLYWLYGISISPCPYYSSPDSSPEEYKPSILQLRSRKTKARAVRCNSLTSQTTHEVLAQ